MLISIFLAHVFSSLPINNSCTPNNRIYDCTMQLVCSNEGFCEFCTKDSDCDDLYYCKYNKKEHAKLCQFEPLIHKWNIRTIIGMIVVFIAGIFVSGVGIGGGALFVPIMMLINSYPADYCVSSSNPIIFGGSLAVCLFNLRLKHPEYNRPLINYNVAAIIEPLSWLGTIVGVIMNGVCPDWLLYIMQFALFSYTCITTFKKGYKDYKKMKEQKEKGTKLEDIMISPKDDDAKDLKDSADLNKSVEKPDFQDSGVTPLNENNDNETNDNTKENQESNDHEIPSFVDSHAGDSVANTNEEVQAEADINNDTDSKITKADSKVNLKLTKSSHSFKSSKELQEPLNPNDEDEDSTNLDKSGKPKKAFSPWVLVILATIWVIFCILPFIRGSNTMDSIVGIKFCSTVYWVVTFVPYPFYLLISYFMIRIARHYPVLGPNADLSIGQIIKLIVFGLTAGVCSGFLGIGGGVIKGPMLLALGIEAEEMAATSTFLVFLTSCITSIQFIAKGTMLYSEFGIYVAFGFVAFIIGINLLKILINRTGNRSLVLWILSAAIGVSALLIAYIGIDDVVDSFKNHRKMGFKKYC